MDNDTPNLTRRALIRTVTVVGGTAVIGPALVIPVPARAAEKVDVTTAPARALGYVEAAEEADVERFGDKARQARQGAQKCSNCRFYAEPGQDWAICPLFGGRQVAGAGWCNAWIEV